MSEVKLEHIYKVYEGGVRAVNDFTLDILDKEFVVFVGPSGCGKSTTLRMIAGLENITAGRLFIDGALMNETDSKDRDIAMVFQSYALYPHMTVYQNMAFGLKLRRLPPEEIEKRVKTAADILEIADLLTRKPKALSGGQRQRVALGRAIVREPKVFLLDEPLSNLDAKLRVQMRTEITKLHKRLATTFIYVTHDQTEAMTMGDRIVVMNKGFIQQVDTPVNLYENPTNLFVATFLGSPQMNILPCHLVKEKGTLFAHINGNEKLCLSFPSLKAKELTDDSFIGKKMLLGIRPEHISLANEGLPAEIDVIEQLGDETIVYAKVEGLDNDILVKGESTGRLKAKETIHLNFHMDKSHLFDEETGNSVMDVPRMNRVLCVMGDKEATFGPCSYVFPESYRKRILERAYEQKDVYLSFSPLRVHLEKEEGDLAIPGKVEFTVEKTDCITLFLAVKGLSKPLVTNLPLGSTIKSGDDLTFYIKQKDIFVEDEKGNKLISREEIIPNVFKGELKTVGQERFISFGPNHFKVEGITDPDGPHEFLLKEDMVSIVLSKKDAKKLCRENPEHDPKSLINASAYDEDPLGEENAIFVKIKGMDNYATLLVKADFSVYKAPTFKLALKPGAIKVIK